MERKCRKCGCKFGRTWDLAKHEKLLHSLDRIVELKYIKSTVCGESKNISGKSKNKAICGDNKYESGVESGI